MDAATTLPSFDDFARSHRAKLEMFAGRFRLEIAEVKNTAYLAWFDATRTYDPAHVSRASFSTFAMRTLEYMLIDQTGGLRVYQGGHAADHEDDAGDGVGYYAHDIPALAVIDDSETQLEELLTRCYADVAFPEVVKGLAVYAHPNYRAVIDGVWSGKPSAEIARQMGCTARCVNQMIQEIVRILNRSDPTLDQKLIPTNSADGAVEAETVYLRPLDALHCAIPPDLDREPVVRLASSLLGNGQFQPIIIDQFQRVLEGVKRVIAARLIGWRWIKTITHAVTEGTNSRSDEAYQRARDRYCAWRASDDRPLPLVPALERQSQAGRLHPLVALRLARLPLSEQSLLVRCLGEDLLPHIGVREANALIDAFDHDRVAAAATRLRERIARPLRAALNRPDAPDVPAAGH